MSGFHFFISSLTLHVQIKHFPTEQTEPGQTRRPFSNGNESMFVPADGQKQETKLGGGANRHCFNNLKANTQYKISVYAQLLDGTEGPAVTVTEKTREYTHTDMLAINHVFLSYSNTWPRQTEFQICYWKSFNSWYTHTSLMWSRDTQTDSYTHHRSHIKNFTSSSVQRAKPPFTCIHTRVITTI